MARRQGGKRRLLKHHYPHFPVHECYVKAFAGAAAALLLCPHPAKVEVLNDVNGERVWMAMVGGSDSLGWPSTEHSSGKPRAELTAVRNCCRS